MFKINFQNKFSERSGQKELMDDLTLSGDALRKNLDELETINYWLGGNQVVINALNKLLKADIIDENVPLRIADLGSGGGDILRMIAKWAKKKKIQTELYGIDANVFMIEYAKEKAKKFPEIQFLQKDVFAVDFAYQDYDIVICSLFCHHFSNAELIVLFKQLHLQVGKAVIINDLHRHSFAYYAIKIITRLFRGSYLVRNDAPLSVLRAFKKKELVEIIKQSGIEHYQIKWLWAFRYQIIFYSRQA